MVLIRRTVTHPLGTAILGRVHCPTHLNNIRNFISYSVFFSTLFALSACKTPKEETPVFVPHTGQIQVLNNCGIPKAAEAVRNFLTDRGFDVVEFGNGSYWNFSKTIIVARTTNKRVAESLGFLLGTGNVIQVIDSSYMVEATVLVGKDYHRLIKRN